MTKPVHPTFWPALLETRDEAPGVRTFKFKSPEGFRFVPGQFLMFHFADDPKTWRAYSLASSPTKASAWFEVTVGMVGAFSDRLGALKPHEEGGLAVRGPFGKWVYDGTPHHAVLVCGGTGLTPMRAMCQFKADLGLAGKISVFYSAKTAADLLYAAEYDAWRAAGISVSVRTTRDGGGARWKASEIAAEAGPDAVFYVCGPKTLVEEMKAGLAGSGVPADAVRTEKWGDYTDLF